VREEEKRTNLIVLKNQSSLDVFRYELDIVLLESFQRSFLVVIDSSLFESIEDQEETRRSDSRGASSTRMNEAS